jgi:DNA repair photolyase
VVFVNKPVVREVHSRSVLVRSRIPGVSFAINPYRGCGHGCAYCYAVFMQRYHPRSEGWGEYVDVKVNAPEVLERDIRQFGPGEKGTVLLSSVCDPYQPEEARYKLTRRLLAILLNHSFPVSILTKSSLITRDIDILKRFGDIEAGLTVTGLPEPDRRLLEPRASPHRDRISALKELKEAGIPTYAFVGPILPGLTDLEGTFQDIKGLVGYAFVDRLNLKRATWDRLEPFMTRHYPRLLPLYRELYRGSDELWNETIVRVSELAGKHRIKIIAA